MSCKRASKGTKSSLFWEVVSVPFHTLGKLADVVEVAAHFGMALINKTAGVINAMREDKGLLHNRYDMGAYVKKSPESAFKGNYCTEYGFRVDTEKHAFLLRCNPTKGDYDFYCYCYVKEWLDKHMAKAEQGIRFIDPHYKELFRIPDGGKIIITYDWGEKAEKS